MHSAILRGFPIRLLKEQDSVKPFTSGDMQLAIEQLQQELAASRRDEDAYRDEARKVRA